MPRIPHLGIVLGTVLLAVSAQAQTSAQAVSAQVASAQIVDRKPVMNSTPDARVQHVVVHEANGAMEVEIQTSGAPVSPDTQIITGPDRIVVDFPGALPAADLRALKVNKGTLKGVRSGLFFSNPPITRVVLDLTEPQSYKISTNSNGVVVRLGQAQEHAQISQAPGAATATSSSITSSTSASSAGRFFSAGHSSSAHLQTASLGDGQIETTKSAAIARLSNSAASTAQPTQNQPVAIDPVATTPPASPKPPVTVTFTNGLLRVQADKATLAQVLFEVQRQTQAEIAIPAGAEQEQVAADIGPAPARDVLGSLLNGSPYNFIFVGTQVPCPAPAANSTTTPKRM